MRLSVQTCSYCTQYRAGGSCNSNISSNSDQPYSDYFSSADPLCSNQNSCDRGSSSLNSSADPLYAACNNTGHICAVGKSEDQLYRERFLNSIDDIADSSINIFSPNNRYLMSFGATEDATGREGTDHNLPSNVASWIQKHLRTNASPALMEARRISRSLSFILGENTVPVDEDGKKEEPLIKRDGTVARAVRDCRPCVRRRPGVLLPEFHKDKLPSMPPVLSRTVTSPQIFRQATACPLPSSPHVS